MAHPHHLSQFGDTTFTKVFVGGLAWETPTAELRTYFEQFGHILEAVIITDKITRKSKGYGFVTFRDPESARRACDNPNPVIDGRRTNCNIALLGRPRPSPPPGGGAPTYGRVAAPLPPPPHVIYPTYGYPTYTPDHGYYQAVYNPQVHHQAQYYRQMFRTTSTPLMGSPYYYGYALESPRGTYSAQHSQRMPPSTRPGPSFHIHMEGTFPPPSTLQLSRHPFPFSSGN